MIGIPTLGFAGIKQHSKHLLQVVYSSHPQPFSSFPRSGAGTPYILTETSARGLMNLPIPRRISPEKREFIAISVTAKFFEKFS